jgi:uncharacterized protein YjdB
MAGEVVETQAINGVYFINIPKVVGDIVVMAVATKIPEPTTITTIEPTTTAPKTSLSISVPKKTLYVNETIAIKTTVKNGQGKTTYSSGNKNIATVSEKGVVKGVKAGNTTITVMNNGVKKSFAVTVKNPSLSVTTKTLKLKNSFTLKINGQVGTAKFAYSKNGIVSVRKINGKTNQYKVTAKKKGTTTITVTTNGNVKLKCKVTVK